MTKQYQKCSQTGCEMEGRFVVLGLGNYCYTHQIEANKAIAVLKDWTEKNPKAWEEIQLNALKKAEEKLK